MELDFAQLYLPFIIGLGFGFAYFILFVEFKSFEPVYCNHKTLIAFLSISFLCLLGFSYLMHGGSLGKTGYLRTIPSFNIAIATISGINSLYFLGIIPVKKKTLEVDSNSNVVVQALKKLFLGFPFILLGINAGLLAIYINQSSYSVNIAFLGIFTSLISIIIVQRKRRRYL